VRHDGEIRLALVANGYECGFSTCWPPASRLILDLFEEAWADSSRRAEERLIVAFEQARDRFSTRAPALVPPDADFPDDLPGAVLLAVAAVDGTAHAAWIGGDIAVLARGFAAAFATTPHTQREQYTREHPDEVIDPESIPNVLVRTLGHRAANQDPPAVATFQLQAGDTLVLLSKANFRGPRVPASEAAFAAAAYSSPAILAERLADLAFANEDAPYAATAVLRFDEVDVESEIERLIDRYEPDPRHGTWLRDWARSHRALPVTFDMGGVIPRERRHRPRRILRPPSGPRATTQPWRRWRPAARPRPARAPTASRSRRHNSQAARFAGIWAGRCPGHPLRSTPSARSRESRPRADK
jgi:hypothetical protein